MPHRETTIDWRLPEDFPVARSHQHHRRRFRYRRRHQYQRRDHLHRWHYHAAYSSFLLTLLHPRPSGAVKQPAALKLRTPHIVAPASGTLQRLTNQRTRNNAYKKISPGFKSFPIAPPWLPFMRRKATLTDQCAKDIRAVLTTSATSHASVSSVQLLHHQRLQQIYEVKLSDMTTMLAVMPPPPMLRILRSEQNLAESEAAVIRWLRTEIVRSSHSGRPSSPPELNLPGKVSSETPSDSATSATDTHSSNVRADEPHSLTLEPGLLQYLPTPISLSRPPSPPSPPSSTPNRFLSSSSLKFNVFTPAPGVPIAALPAPLTSVERASTEYQAGQLVRQLSRLTPASGHFGPALAVLAPPPSGLGTPQSSHSTVGMGSWSVAFHAILESILRDGEDVAVSLAYPTIRKHFRRLGHLLDTVTVPSLVVVDAMDDTNLLVQRPETPKRELDKTSVVEPQASTRYRQRTDHRASSQARGKTRVEGENDSSARHNAQEKNNTLRVEPSAGVRVTGLRDWSQCIFGDPLFALVFCEQPSPAFLQGFNGLDYRADTSSGDSQLSQEEKDTTSRKDGALPAHRAERSLSAAQERRENKAVRLLLYQCYHAVVQIVKGFYRPGKDQTTKELAARKRLTGILARLEAIENDPKRSFLHRRPSGEMPPTKKPKTEPGDEPPGKSAGKQADAPAASRKV